MKKIYITFPFLLILIAFTGCNKLLEVKPQSQITEQLYFQNESDFAPYVTGIYSSMRSFVGDVDALIYGTERSEELIVATTNRLTTAFSHILSPTTGAFNYTSYYRAIGNCNLLLERIEAFPFSSAQTKNRLKAETFSLRAFFYFQLVRIIGDTPLMLKAITDDNVPLLDRSNASDVLKQIFSDLDTANSLFPEKTFISKYRFSYPAAQALKAEAKLWSAKVAGGGMEDLNGAITAIVEVEKANLSLLTNIRAITTTRENSEIIFAAYFHRDESNANYARNALPFLTNIQTATNLDSIPYALTSANGQAAYQISTQSRALFNGLTSDKRIPNTFIIERQGTIQKLAWITKYPGNKYADDRISDNDIIIFRLADLFLMKAEAYAALNNTTLAVDYLNKVRVRAGNGNYSGTTDKPTVELEIFNERGRELFFENKRWYDIVRFHHGGTINAYTYVPNLRNKNTPLFWPISTTILSVNPNLKQTQGY